MISQLELHFTGVYENTLSGKFSGQLGLFFDRALIGHNVILLVLFSLICAIFILKGGLIDFLKRRFCGSSNVRNSL